ncbi:hypothetical protein RIF29_09777 [Crotalaria pallida]|uniref:Cystatin domain-containing protein n=1 Tax=Crotalaria pallida TaxID=3830 RepID=A0AAN9FUN7_CROPI
MIKKVGCILLFLLLLVDVSKQQLPPTVPIKNLDDPYVVSIVNFAVTMNYSHEHKGKLKLVRIIKGVIEKQPVGDFYYLVLAINDGKNYKTIVQDHTNDYTWYRELWTEDDESTPIIA